MLVHCCGWSWAIVTLGDWKDMKPQPPIYHYLNYIVVFSKYRQRLYIHYKYYMVSLHVFQDPNSMSISWCCRMGKISTIFRTRYDFSEWHMLLWWVLMVYVSMFACDPVPGSRQIISKYKSLRIVWGNWSLVKYDTSQFTHVMAKLIFQNLSAAWNLQGKSREERVHITTGPLVVNLSKCDLTLRIRWYVLRFREYSDPFQEREYSDPFLFFSDGKFEPEKSYTILGRGRSRFLGLGGWVDDQSTYKKYFIWVVATQIFFIFTPKIGEDFPFWLIFFRWVETTN